MEKVAPGGPAAVRATLDGIVDDLQSATPLQPGGQVKYPGEGMFATRQENTAKGVPVDAEQWAALQAMMRVGGEDVQ